MVDKRRPSAIERHNRVHSLAEQIESELGDLYKYVSKSYLYERISKETKLTTRQISYILNHTRPTHDIMK